MSDGSALSLRGGGVSTAGQVAELLGVSPVTLRSWDSRYGMGPTAHAPGTHRRYSDEDIERLHAMCALIAAGTPTREAAEMAAGGYHRARFDDVPLNEIAAELVSNAEALNSAALAELADYSLAEHGVHTAWSEAFAPALRKLGRRWGRYGDRVDVESTLSDAVDTALERRNLSHPLPAVAPCPALLTCCPGERHVLPMKALRLALRERGIGAALLGTGVPAEATVAAVDKLDAPVTILWSLTRQSADPGVARSVADVAGAPCLAGPGWSAGLRKRYWYTNSLADAADLVTELVDGASER